VVLPVYVAAGLLALIVASTGLSTLNRRLEWRADYEGAALCNDPVGLSSALAVAKKFSDEARRRVYGPPPWRWILSPLSWRMPSHPPMADRIQHLLALAPIESAADITDPTDPRPGVAS
jgi:Zn-dependent protease with chaperone function